MNVRILLAMLIVTVSLTGCGWRRGCSKCSSKIEVLPPPPPAPTYYLPPQSCPTGRCP